MRSFTEALAIAESWARPPFDPDTIATIKALLSLPQGEKEKAITDRFGYDLSFGTAGMRAIMDVGTARINEYTIARVSRAVASVVLRQTDSGATHQSKLAVIIGYDGRKHSEKYAHIATREFLAAGIDVHAFDRIIPTPLVPFAVRRLKAAGGIMITSSHNAAPYNGYKVYGANGAQILSPFDTDVMAAMENDVPLAQTTPGKLSRLNEDLLKDYVDWATREIDFSPREKRDLKIIFTPLHGAAGAMMNAVFYRAGFKNFLSVPQQYEPHPGFPTVKAPNPENKDSLDMARAMAIAENADLILATDGDGDRVGVAYLRDGKFVSLTGNQIGTLFLYYALTKLRDQKADLPSAFALSSVVSTPLTRSIAQKFGIQHFETLTGFKNMGNKADAISKANPSARHVLSFEEAFGVTLGDSRDKDGLISNLTAAHIAADGGIAFWLTKMYADCGYAAEDAVEAEFPGASGIEAMNALVDKMRTNPLNELLGIPIASIRDFMTETPAQNMLIYTNTNGDWLAVRPSGTEPKIKAYVGVRDAAAYSADTEENNRKRLDALCEIARQLLQS